MLPGVQAVSRQINDGKSCKAYSTQRCHPWLKKSLNFKFLASGKIQRKSSSVKYLYMFPLFFPKHSLWVTVSVKMLF